MSLETPSLPKTMQDLDTYVGRTLDDIYQDSGELHYLVADGLLQSTPLVMTSNPRVWAKLETEHSVQLEEETLVIGAFKYRGALVATARAMQRNPHLAGTVLATQGNHGLGGAAAAHQLGVSCDVYTPRTLNPVKRKGLELLGANIHDDNDSLAAALKAAKRAARKDRTRIFVHPFDDADVISGQATIGVEIAEQVRELDAQHPGLRRPTLTLAPLGGGGMLTGVAIAVKQRRERAIAPNLHVVATEITNKEKDEWCDGTHVATGKAGRRTLNDARYIAGRIVVGRRAVAQSILRIEASENRTLEPAGVLSHAGSEVILDDPLLANHRLIVIESGQHLSVSGRQRAVEFAA